MEQQERSNLRISGAGSAGGGVYNDVEINGAGSINGDVECIRLSTNGASNISGNVKAQSVKMNGTASFRGDIKSGQIDVNGAAGMHGNVDTGRIKVSGTIDIDGNLHSAEVDAKGAIKVKGDCEAESFRSAGAFNIGGLLNAGSINASIVGSCRAREIGGEKIEIKRYNGFVYQIQRFIKDIFSSKEMLEVDIIEGDDIYLETTTARIVRGNNIVIGPDCDIQLVEYKGTLKVTDNARVREQKQV
jgi:cytoskeletal protein CcmA (bactofilin family)